ncbi:MAG: RsmE family RNA methyltransferase, partial [Bacteriovoracales bacterium]
QGIGQGIITKISPESIELKVENISPKYFAPFELLVGLSRPPTCKKLLEHGTSLGVSRFNFYPAQLSEKSYQESNLFKDYQKYLKYGLSQSGIYHQMPEVNLKKDFSGEQKFVLSPKTKKTFLDYKIQPNKKITLAIGPERGFLNREIDAFKDQGFLEVSIGPPILRVEIATFAALGQLHLLLV